MAISGPIAPYSNVPIRANYYNPNVFVISAITLGVTTTVTTTVDMNYDIGQLVRLIIPPSYGCRQLNQKQGYVISLPASDQVEISIDSSQNVDAFINSGDQAQILAIGDINNGYQSSTGSNISSIEIPGSFINVS